MKLQFAKLTIVLACSLTAVGGMCSTSDAGIIPWVYDAMFGPVGSMRYRTARYAPYNYRVSPGQCSPCGSSGCAPAMSFYAPGCSPCATGGCPTGGCAVASVGQPSTVAKPIPDPTITAPKKTFADEAPATKIPTELEDDGFRRRREGADEPVETDAFKIPNTIIPKKGPAPSKPIEIDDADKTKSEDETKTESEDKSETGKLNVPALNLDEKSITWRPVPNRKRLTIQANFANPQLARKSVDLKIDWVAVPKSTKLAKN